MKIAGLSIEGAQFRASIMKRTMGFVTHIRNEEHALPLNPAERIAAVREILTHLKTEYGIKSVALGMDMTHFTIKLIDLPCITREDITNALVYELENHLPLPPDDYLYDFITVNTSEAMSKNLVFAIKRDKLSWLEECLEGLGLGLLSVRCTGVEIINELLSHKDSHHSMLLQQSGESFHVIGLENGKPVLFKTAYGVGDALARVEENMAGFKSLYTTGISDLTPFGRLNAMSISYDIPSLVALADMRRRPLKLNFIPEELAAKKLDLFPYAAIAMAMLCVLLYVSTSAVAYYKDYRALKAVNTWLDELEQTSHDLLETKREIEAIVEKRQFLRNFKTLSNKKIEYIKELSSVLPKSAWIVSLNIDGKGRIEIDGYATRTAEVIGPLENSPLFKNVEITAPVLLRDDLERFSIRMEVVE